MDGKRVDILIEVPRTSSRSLHFHRAADVIDVGRMLAAAALDSYEAQRDSDDASSEEPTDIAGGRE
jgi:NTE family protein